jgi:DNA-binding transcriptional MerR regulator
VIDSVDTDDAAPRRTVKSEAAFRTISEVSEDLEVPQHVLRFWESKFPQIKPLKRGGGRRYYRPEDVQLLKRIRDLLYKDGYTIRGVQKLLREQIRGSAPAAAEADGLSIDALTEAELLVEAVLGAPSAPQAPQFQPQTPLPFTTQIEFAPLPEARRPIPAPVEVQAPLELRQESHAPAPDRREMQALLAELEDLRAILSSARQLSYQG